MQVLHSLGLESLCSPTGDPLVTLQESQQGTQALLPLAARPAGYFARMGSHPVGWVAGLPSAFWDRTARDKLGVEGITLNSLSLSASPMKRTIFSYVNDLEF